MSKVIPAAAVEVISLGVVLQVAHEGGIEDGKAAQFTVEAPCGCTRTYQLTLVGGDSNACVNARPTNPKDIN